MIMNQVILDNLDSDNNPVNFGNEGTLRAIGIQATPGTKFCFYNGGSQNEITMGPSGIYQINFTTNFGAGITGVEFLSSVGALPIIVDYIIDEQEQGGTTNVK